MYKKTKHSPTFSQRGQIIAERNAHDFIRNVAPNAYKFNDAAKRNKTMDMLCSELKENGYYFELVYDAGHGKRYVMFVFRASIDKDYDTRIKENQGARRMALDFQCAPENTMYDAMEP